MPYPITIRESSREDMTLDSTNSKRPRYSTGGYFPITLRIFQRHRHEFYTKSDWTNIAMEEEPDVYSMYAARWKHLTTKEVFAKFQEFCFISFRAEWNK